MNSIFDHNVRKRRIKKITPIADSSDNRSDNDSPIIKTTNASAISQNGSLQVYQAESLISEQVPRNRRKEIYEYLRLFGYKPDRTILQVHITGFFRKRNYSERQVEKHRAAVKRYGGTTFVVVGRTA